MYLKVHQSEKGDSWGFKILVKADEDKELENLKTDLKNDHIVLNYLVAKMSLMMVRVEVDLPS